MPKETDRLKLPLPLGNENVTRESINGIFEKIDAGVATRESILIPAESDLNSYITEGEYYCPTNATVGTLANSPVGVAFHLTIEKHAGVVQTLTTFEPSNLQVFQRNYYVGWGPWKKAPTRDDIEEVKVYTDQKIGEIVINDASITDKGIVQLSNAVDGTREDLAATEKAVRDARVAAETNAKNASLPRTGGELTGKVKFSSWGGFSSNSSGLALYGSNCYLDGPTYRFENTHANFGARGMVMRFAGGSNPEIYIFDTGLIATTNGVSFTPTLKRVLNQTDYDTLFQSVSSGKASIAAAITGKGVAALGSDTFPQLATKIGQINTNKRFYESYHTGEDAYINVNFGFTASIVKIANSYGSLCIAGKSYNGVYGYVGGGNYMSSPYYPSSFTGAGLKDFYLYKNGGTYSIQAWE
ncbi:tail fiber protein [Paenibacillus sp. Y5S-9]|uniref:tail fiber protein n=1 Tax=Paenibacillus sp. Y5S-9 TaxID=3122489 RepID=UPI0030D369AF